MEWRTLIPGTNGVEIDINVGEARAKEHKSEERVERKDGHNKQDANDPTLLVRAGVVA